MWGEVKITLQGFIIKQPNLPIKITLLVITVTNLSTQILHHYQYKVNIEYFLYNGEQAVVNHLTSRITINLILEVATFLSTCALYQYLIDIIILFYNVNLRKLSFWLLSH